jgi:hypothetical protein
VENKKYKERGLFFGIDGKYLFCGFEEKLRVTSNQKGSRREV